jgi:hypothetical protein
MVVIHGNVAMFRGHRPQASQVNPVGDFDRWETHECRMVRGPSGNWFACLRLADGGHSFRYYADGQWLSDNGEVGSKAPPGGRGEPPAYRFAAVAAGMPIASACLFAPSSSAGRPTVWWLGPPASARRRLAP